MRVLFFMPFGNRTGAELALYNLIRYAAARGWEVGVACREGGALLGGFPPAVRVFDYSGWGLARRAYAAARRRVAGDVDGFLTAAHAAFRPDVWYVNTIAQPWVVRQAERLGLPVALHTHELEHIWFGLTADEARSLVRYPRLIVAGSEAARAVCLTLGREGPLEVCYATLDPGRVRPSEGGRARVRRELGAGESTFVWAASGGLDPNKNPSLFVSAAAALVSAGADARFVWLGGGDSGYALYVRGKAEALGLAGRVTFAGALAGDYFDYLDAADGVVVTSRFESFSLAAAEAAHLGKPVVSFDSGGVREVLREGMGKVVESWNEGDLVREMWAVMRGETPFDPAFARRRVEEFRVETQGPRWEAAMRGCFGRG